MSPYLEVGEGTITDPNEFLRSAIGLRPADNTDALKKNIRHSMVEAEDFKRTPRDVLVRRYAIWRVRRQVENMRSFDSAGTKARRFQDMIDAVADWRLPTKIKNRILGSLREHMMTVCGEAHEVVPDFDDWRSSEESRLSGRLLAAEVILEQNIAAVRQYDEAMASIHEGGNDAAQSGETRKSPGST